MPLKFLFTLLPMLFMTDGGGGGGDDDKTSLDDAKDDRDDQPLGESGKKALDDERQKRKDAEKLLRDTQKKLDDLNAQKQKDADDKAAEEGRWKDLAEQRDADLTKAKGDLDAATGELEELRSLAKTRVDDLLKDIPKEIKDLEPDPEHTSIVKRLAWAEKAAQAAGKATGGPRGNRPDPAPNPKPNERAKSPISVNQING